jgi:hypothetical protein
MQALGGVCGIDGEGDDALDAIEVLSLPPLHKWSPASHSSFPKSFRSVVYVAQGSTRFCALQESCIAIHASFWVEARAWRVVRYSMPLLSLNFR